MPAPILFHRETDRFSSTKWRTFRSDCDWATTWHQIEPILHESTEPEAIAKAQCEAIQEVMKRYNGANRKVMGRDLTPEEISDLVVLPVSVVKRRLEKSK